LKVSKAAARELKFERENYQKDETVDSFLQENNWNLKEKEDDINIELTKTVENLKINVHFQSRSPNSMENENQEQGQQEGE